MLVTPGNCPDPFYIFVNQAPTVARQNFELTRTFISTGFVLAFPEFVPAGVRVIFGKQGRPALLSAGPDMPVDPDLRSGYVNGTLEYLPLGMNPMYFGFMNPFTLSTVASYYVEADAELVRREVEPLAPSRLSAIYAFGDYQSCLDANVRHGWPLDQVRAFRLRPHEHARVWRANMELVSLAQPAYRGASLLNWEEARTYWRNYWTESAPVTFAFLEDGKTNVSHASGCTWEYLIEGVLDPVPWPTNVAVAAGTEAPSAQAPRQSKRDRKAKRKRR